MKLIKIEMDKYVFLFAIKSNINFDGIFLLSIRDLNNCGDMVYSDYYKSEFDEFFINDEHKRRFITFVDSLSPNDVFLKAKLKRACEDTILYLQNNKKEK